MGYVCLLAFENILEWEFDFGSGTARWSTFGSVSVAFFRDGLKFGSNAHCCLPLPLNLRRAPLGRFPH
jgi:hypothetical protein